MPTKDLLMQIIKCENLDWYFKDKVLSELNKHDILARILVGDQEIFESHDKIKINKNPDSQLLRSCSTSFLDPQLQQEDHLFVNLATIDKDLNALFSFYCSYGDPTNTTSLKSAKLQKMLRDAGLVI